MTGWTNVTNGEEIREKGGEVITRQNRITEQQRWCNCFNMKESKERKKI